MSKETSPLTGKQVQIFPTETCNLKCDGCPYPDQPPERQQALRNREINPDNWQAITDFLYAEGNRFFCIMGGEPASYKGIEKVIANITTHPDTFVLLSTSGIHLLHNQQLRNSVGEALAQPRNRTHKNGIAISFDTIPPSGKITVKDSRALKAQQGLDFVTLMQQEFPGQITYVANVMVRPSNLSQVPDIQTYLEERGVFTNLCTQQRICFGESQPTFNSTHEVELSEVAVKMIERKVTGGSVVNSVAYLSRLPTTIGMENYRCWEEPNGNPVLDIGPDGKLRFCNWIEQNLDGGPPGRPIQDLMNGSVTWDEFWAKSKQRTAMICGGCSWSRRDRGTTQMVDYDSEILRKAHLPILNTEDPKLQNIWVQAQLAQNPPNA